MVLCFLCVRDDENIIAIYCFLYFFDWSIIKAVIYRYVLILVSMEALSGSSAPKSSDDSETSRDNHEHCNVEMKASPPTEHIEDTLQLYKSPITVIMIGMAGSGKTTLMQVINSSRFHQTIVL